MFWKYHISILPLWESNFYKCIMIKFIIHLIMFKKVAIEAISLILLQTIFQPTMFLKPMFLKASFIIWLRKFITNWLSWTFSHESPSNFISNIRSKTINWNMKSHIRNYMILVKLSYYTFHFWATTVFLNKCNFLTIILLNMCIFLHFYNGFMTSCTSEYLTHYNFEWNNTSVTSCVMSSLITFIRVLIMHQIQLVNQILSKLKEFQIKFNLNLQEQVKIS
jgi:hypothetical protein